MAKMLFQKEAEEMINAITAEFWYTPSFVRWHKNEWQAYDKTYWSIKIFKWTLKIKKRIKPWCTTPTSVELVKKVEKVANDWLNKAQEADELRHRHATRILDKEIKK